jgi:hypothetical protein
MKKILILLVVLVVALTLGTAYADSKDMSAENGITVFEAVPAASHDLGPGLTLENGITAFEIVPVEYGAEGAAAGGLRAMEPSMELRNSITVFDTSAIVTGEPN